VRRSTAVALSVALLVGALAAGAPAAGQTVTLSGSLGDRKAVLVIDGEPRTLAVGESVRGIKLLALADGQAQIEMQGRRSTLRIGQAPVRISAGAAGGGGQQIVLTAGLGGHFTSTGSINGKAVSFIVDTGATAVSIGEPDAQRIGLDLQSADRRVVTTANGMVAVHRVLLSVVRVGDVEVHNVEAIVLPNALPHVLLGNSFLTRFQMKRENDRLTLDKRP
jgi:aspartyl protease family protein